jgi:exonuclease SbcC
MVIEKLKLIDFGRHEKIEVDLDSPVVGLLGPNGCGKSTVLAAIEFAFTGRLEDEQKSYVRYFNQEGGATNATVEIWFRKDGNRGRIMRRVGKSPKRELEWDGQTLTKAAEVEATLEQILGVDRSAITSSVFINQGEVKKLVEGTNAEREALLTKLLVLTYLEDRNKALEKKIQTMAAGLEDYSSLLDEQRIRINESMESLTEATNELNTIQDMSVEVKRLEKLNSLFERVAAIHRDLQQHKATLLQRKENLANADRNLKGILDGLNYDEYQKKTKIELESIASEITKLSGLSSLKSTVTNKQQDLEKRKQILTSQNDVINKLEIELNGRTSQTLQAVLEQKQVFTEHQAKVTLAQEEMARIQKRIDDSKTPDGDYSYVDSYKNNKEEYTRKRMDLETKLPLLEALEECELGHSEAGSITCPVCESVVSNLKILEGLTVTSAREELQKAKKEEDSLNTRIMYLISDEDSRVKRLDQAKTELLSAQKAYLDVSIKAAALSDPRPEQTFEQIKAERDSLYSKEIELRTAVAGVERLKTEISTLEQELKALTASDDWDAASKVSPNTIAEYQSKHKAITDKSSEVTNALTLRQAASSQHESSQEADIKLHKEWEAVNSEINQVVTAEDKAEGRDADTSTDQRLGYLAMLNDNQERRQQANGKVTSCNKQLERDRNRLKEIEALQEKNIGRRSLIEDLRRIKDVFGRAGVKEYYIRHRFEQLAELTREFLMDLDANFTIDVDPDNATSFTFTRVDEDIVYAMSMNKLSGGQKVRLAIAFLMAVQRLIVPEVAFLVIDEPSDGLDEDGIESFKELIMEMRNKLSNSDSQVIICEHRPQMHVAFEKKLELK